MLWLDDWKTIIGSHVPSPHLSKCCVVATAFWCTRAEVCMHNKLSLIARSHHVLWPHRKNGNTQGQKCNLQYSEVCVALNQFSPDLYFAVRL